ncbi:hypothetical protein E4U33_000572 [Claviceps sp. LM78 group G4]|nr:hypothetical protein E4U33_000572 [Claviceps sp. LM78 group G4]
MLCGKDGSIDLSEFLEKAVRGPGGFKCSQRNGGAHECAFTEPEMDKLIRNLIGDSSILLECQSGECLHETQVPGYTRPIKHINTPLIAGVITICALFLVAIIITTWILSRRKLRHGAIRLEDSDHEATSMMAEHKPATLQFEKVSYQLNGKVILSNILGTCNPGEVTAIIGASGAGKTTFLDILARKNKCGSVKGNFFVNGMEVHDSEFKKMIGFVDQEDTMLPTLTVHETILNSALLRLPRGMSRLSKEHRVLEIERELGIHHIRDSLIGSDGIGRGISGGEKRRVGIACELVTSPSILFLDEPTSGLDAFNAYNVVQSLVTLAKNHQRTVVFTIHQPRSNIVALFDRLVLLAKGNAVFSGSFAHCQSYFDSIGYKCPPGHNIADYLVDLTMQMRSQTSPGGASMIANATSAGPSSARAIRSSASVLGNSVGDDSTIETAATTRRRKSQQDSILLRQEGEFCSHQEQIAHMSYSLNTGARTHGYDKHQVESSPVITSPSQQGLHDVIHSSTTGTDVELLTHAFAQSEVAEQLRCEIRNAVAVAAEDNGINSRAYNYEALNTNVGPVGHGYARIGYWNQFLILSQRTWKNLYRDPMLMLTHYAISIILAVFSGYLFYGLTDDIPGFQNRLGLFFFLLALFGFSTLTSLNVFSTERLLFLRERANGYYSPITYFTAKVLFDIIPLRIMPPILMGSIIYPMTGLVPDFFHFFIFMLVLVLFNLAAASICLLVGILCQDGGLANLIGSLVMLFSLLFAGFLLNHDATPASALWLQKISIFHYGFEALIVNEVVELTLVDKKYGLDITVPGAAILSSFGFDNSALWTDVSNLGIFCIVFMILAYLAMHFLLIEKR